MKREWPLRRFIIGLLIVLVCFLSNAHAATREISETWDVANGPDKKQKLSLFQTESVEFELTSTFSGSAFQLATNDVVVWEITGWDDYTNVYACVTGTVTSATNGISTYSLTPEQSNFDDGVYRGFAKAMQYDGTNVSTRAILAYQHITVNWSPNSGSYNLVEPLGVPTAYSYTNETWTISDAPARVFNESWAVENGEEKKQVLSFFQTEAVQLNETFTSSGSALDCSDTNTTFIWEINGWDDYTNTYALVTGSVIDGTNGQVRFELPPWKSNITNGNYLGFVRALEDDGTNVVQSAVLAYQHIKVEWAPDSRSYSLVESIPNPYYTIAEVDALVLSLSNSISNLTTTQATHTASIANLTTTQAVHAVSIGSISNDLTTVSNAFNSSKLDITNGVFAGSLTSTNSGYTVDMACDEIAFRFESGTNIYRAILGPDQLRILGSGSLALNSTSLSLDSHGVLSGDADSGFKFGYPYDQNILTYLYGDVQISKGDITADTLTLDSTLAEWADLQDVGFITNAIAQNTPITVTNDSSWTGWTTTGDLTTNDTIFLEADEYLLSPVQTNGIADYTVTSGSDQGGTLSTEEAVTVGDVLGSELVTNGDFESGYTGWTVGSSWTIGADASFDGLVNGTLINTALIEAAKSYRISWDIIGAVTATGGWPRMSDGTDRIDYIRPGDSGSYSFDYTTVSGGGLLQVQANIGATFTIDNISVKEVISTGTNTVSVPYHGTAGQVLITAGSTLPGATAGLTVSNVVITGYGDLTEAAQTNYVSGLCRIEAETRDCDLTRKVYVDQAETDAKDYSDDQLDDYAADSTKTLRGANMVLGSEWTTGSSTWQVCGQVSGPGQIGTSTNKMWMGQNFYNLVSIESDADYVYVSNSTVTVTSSNATFEIFAYTNDVVAEPFAEYTFDMMSGDWTRITSLTTSTYPLLSNGCYFVEATFDTTNSTGFIRLMQPVGDSEFEVSTDVMSIGDAEFLINDTVTTNIYQIAVSNGTIIAIQQ